VRNAAGSCRLPQWKGSRGKTKTALTEDKRTAYSGALISVRKPSVLPDVSPAKAHEPLFLRFSNNDLTTKIYQQRFANKDLATKIRRQSCRRTVANIFDPRPGWLNLRTRLGCGGGFSFSWSRFRTKPRKGDWNRRNSSAKRRNLRLASFGGKSLRHSVAAGGFKGEHIL
jgi:hypothetical protein